MQAGEGVAGVDGELFAALTVGNGEGADDAGDSSGLAVLYWPSPVVRAEAGALPILAASTVFMAEGDAKWLVRTTFGGGDIQLEFYGVSASAVD